MVVRWNVLFAAGLLSAGFAAASEPSRSRIERRAEAYLRYYEAQELLAQGRGGEARAKLENVLALDPGSSEVESSLARLCLRDGDFLCARERAEHALRLWTANPAAHRVLADLELQRYGERHEATAFDAALREYEAAAEAAPADGATWNAWIRALATNNRAAEAEQVAQRAAGTPGVDPAGPWISLARVQLGRGDTQAAIAVLEKVDVTGRGMVPILEMLADLRGSRGDAAGQAEALERLRQMRPDDADLAHRLGIAQLDLGDYFSAEAPLREAFAAHPTDPQARRDLARALVRLGRGAEAIDLLRELPPVYRAPHTLLLWAQAAEQADRGAEAADRLEEIVATLTDGDRKSFGTSLTLRAARDRLKAGQPERALALTDGLDAEPGALRIRLDALDALGRPEQATRLLDVRLGTSPGEPGLVALAVRRAERARTGSGVPAGLALLRGAKDRGTVAVGAAEWLIGWDAPQLAAALLDAAGPFDQPSSALLRTRAGVLYTAGRFGEAEAEFRKVLAIDPDDDGALNDLGFLLASEGRSLDEALRLLERAVKIKPDQPSYLDSLGWALFRAGRTGDALPYLQKAARRAREREEPTIREHLGDVYFALGDPARAQAEWSAALALGSDQRDRLQHKIDEVRGRMAR